MHNMTPEEQLLIVTMEECAELSQACSKILRFGKTEKSQEQLVQELGDLTAMIALFVTYGYVTQEQLDAGGTAKVEKLKVWSDIIK